MWAASGHKKAPLTTGGAGVRFTVTPPGVSALPVYEMQHGVGFLFVYADFLHL